MKVHIAAFWLAACAAATGMYSADAASLSWHPVEGNLMTRWAAQVDPAGPWPEYPRPQLVRPQWQSLNGLWEYAITDKDASAPGAYQGKILVPYPIESALSGVRKPLLPNQNLWYHRTFRRPAVKPGERVLLHFGAVDFEATVLVNDQEVGHHAGGYESFSFDITAALKHGNNDVEVKVWDPTQVGPNPHGKQALKPHGIMYTATSGIWQTVWLETVPANYVASLVLTPDVDHRALTVEVRSNAAEGFTVEVSTDHAKVTGKPNERLSLMVPHAHLWSPDDPYLSPLQVRLLKHGVPLDQVGSYFGMRKVEVRKDRNGHERIYLNDRYTYNLGVLDQGFWPDGLYTAPTDAALKSDIQTIKSMGFNTIRKHIKIEPARWYYYCDILGILVWQDMVPPGGDDVPDARARSQFEAEMEANIVQLHNHPSITTWVLFNEGWGAYDQERLESRVKQLDPSRLLNGESGGIMLENGNSVEVAGSAGPSSDLTDIHSYPDPAILHIEDSSKALVLGEYGGIGVFVKGHIWRNPDTPSWGYEQAGSESLAARYAAMFDSLRKLEAKGLTASIYTQPFDVEGEQNGLITYDREIMKIPLEEIRRIHATLLSAGHPPTNPATDPAAPATITHTAFGRTLEAEPVELYTLRNRRGMEARIATYGGIVTSLMAPDRQGHYSDVVLGYDTLEGYLKDGPYFGALIGRYGNRIAKGRFRLDGADYQLATNNGPNALHGGVIGFDKVVWTAVKAEVTPEGPQLTLTYLSRDGEEGYPGNLSVKAVYTLTEDDALRLEYTATSDKDTVVNLTQHSYFNLRGKGDVLGHRAQINADRFTPVDRMLIPTGEQRLVARTPFDFRQPHAIGERIGSEDEQLRNASGYDHNWVLTTPAGTLALDATVYEPESGRVLEVLSDQPGLQFYTGNFLDGSIAGKGGWRYTVHDGFCMEPQHFPDSPNHPDFPSTVLKPGETYHSTIMYRFTTR